MSVTKLGFAGGPTQSAGSYWAVGCDPIGPAGFCEIELWIGRMERDATRASATQKSARLIELF
jgi:hypothetical protein